MRIAGTVVLYNPEREVLDNIKTYLPLIDVLYVMDNSTQEIEFLESIKNLEKVKYISLGGNKGIAKALKIATESAIADGYDFLLSMDQDSKFPTGDFRYIEKFLKDNDTSKLGALGVNYGKSALQVKEEDKNLVQSTDAIITSGMFLNLKSYQQTSGYNEDLFIDLVDNDICYQLKLAGFDVLIMKNIYLKHKLGEELTINFLFHKKTINVHSPLRYYYMYRNFTYLMKYKDKEYRKLIKRRKGEFRFKFILARILFQKPHFKTLKMIMRGKRDGKRGILGPYIERRNK